LCLRYIDSQRERCFALFAFYYLQYLSGEIVVIIRYGYPKIAGVSISF